MCYHRFDTPVALVNLAAAGRRPYDRRRHVDAALRPGNGGVVVRRLVVSARHSGA